MTETSAMQIVGVIGAIIRVGQQSKHALLTVVNPLGPLVQSVSTPEHTTKLVLAQAPASFHAANSHTPAIQEAFPHDESFPRMLNASTQSASL